MSGPPLFDSQRSVMDHIKHTSFHQECDVCMSMLSDLVWRQMETDAEDFSRLSIEQFIAAHPDTTWFEIVKLYDPDEAWTSKYIEEHGGETCYHGLRLGLCKVCVEGDWIPDVHADGFDDWVPPDDDLVPEADADDGDYHGEQ